MAILNLFQNYPLLHKLENNINGLVVGTLFLNNFYIPGSISFNTVALLMRASGTTAKTLTISFGLYSLSGNSISLANSASVSTAPTVNITEWITLGTSATQNITPGNWYFGFLYSTSGNSRLHIYYANTANPGGTFEGPFFEGRLTASSTSVLPVSVATSDLTSIGGSHDNPLVIISA